MTIALVGTVINSTLQFRKEFISLLVSKNHKVFVLACDYDIETRKTILDMGAYPLDYPVQRTGINPIKDIQTLLALIKIFKKIKPDTVFSFFSKPSIYGTLAANMTNIPRKVAMLEGLGYTFIKGEIFSFKRFLAKKIQVFLYKISFKYLNLLILLNEDDLTDLIIQENVKVKKIEIFGGIGVDLAQYEYSVPNQIPFSFIFIGRLLKSKGIIDFCEAAQKVLEKCPDCLFYILGSPDFANPDSITEKELEKYTENKNFIFKGHLTDVRSWIKKSTAFVLPSYREGFPRSTQEAMAMGRPVITTNVPGCRQSVLNGVNGYLVEAGNPHALATQMFNLLIKKSTVDQMSLESRKFAEQNYDITKKNNLLYQMISPEFDISK